MRLSRWLTRRGAPALACVSLAAGLVPSPAYTPRLAATVSASVLSDITADAEWILKAQMPDGAIAHYVDQKAIWPYLANFAAMGLARATAIGAGPKYAAASWRWLAWYQAHQDGNGFVTDYTVTDGRATSTGDMDSTDAYAGTFLLAVRDTFVANADLTKLRSLSTGVDAAVRAIEATQDPADGLTWAKPAWHVKYLMDQAEVYAGLVAGAQIAKKLGNTDLATRATNDAKLVSTGVAALWNTGQAAYDWAKHDSGARTATNWSVLYSDALQQTWAVAFGLVSATRSTTLLTKFASAQPNWASPNATATFSSGPATVGYWPETGLAFGRIGSTVAATSATSIRAAAIGNGRAWPFTTGNAGQLIVLQALPPATKTTTTTTKTATPTTSAVTTTTRPPSTTTTRPPTTSTTVAVGPLSAGVSPSGATVAVTSTTVLAVPPP